MVHYNTMAGTPSFKTEKATYYLFWDYGRTDTQHKIMFCSSGEAKAPDLAYVVRHGQTLAPVARGCQRPNKKGRKGIGPQPTR